MKCLRIYASPDGESHFDEIDLPTTKRSVHPEAVPFDVTASYQPLACASLTSQRGCEKWRGIRCRNQFSLLDLMAQLNTRRVMAKYDMSRLAALY